MRIRHAALLLALLLLPRPTLAQQLGAAQTISVQDSGACALANSCATFAPVTAAPSVVFGVSGTLTTLTAQATADGTNWYAVLVSNTGTGTAPATTITATGLYSLPNVGYLAVRLVGTTVSGSTTTVVATRGFSSGSGGGGTSNANLVSIDGQPTNINAATLNLKQLNIVNSTGNAITAGSTGGNGHGAYFSGNGAGSGIYGLAGPTGSGMQLLGGATSGHGLYARGVAIGDGIKASAEGTDGDGINATALSGSGGYFEALTGGSVTSGSGLSVIGSSTTGNGFFAKANGTNGNGIGAFGIGTGNGIQGSGGSAGNGMTLVGNGKAGLSTTAASGNAAGIQANGSGTNPGFLGLGGATGPGFWGIGGATSGEGFRGTATTLGDGMIMTGTGVGKVGINAANGLGMGFSASNITTNTTTTVKSGAGVLHAVVIDAGATTTGSIVVYDNTAGSGTVLATINSTTAVGNGTFIFDSPFATGLTLVTTAVAGAADLNVFWR